MKLKASQLPAVRLKLLLAQGGKCKLCGEIVKPSEAVLDHDHLHGHIRGVLHRWCNSTLGRLENWAHRSGKGRERFSRFVADYLQAHAVPQFIELHPTFKTEGEKVEAAKAKAKKRRAAKKEQAT